MLDKNTFSESYTRIFGEGIKIGAASDQFFGEFYKRFLKSSDQVAAAFKDTDMNRQQSMLKKSLLYGVNFAENMEYFEALHRIAVLHNRSHYNIKPDLYDLWLDCIVATVKDFDPKFSVDVEISWRLAFAQCITYMKFMYEQ